MRTKLTIMGIVLGIALAGIATAVALAMIMGPVLGLGITAAVALAVVAIYKVAIEPWHARWGATEEEIHRTMPGDELIEGAASTTRAITIRARPAHLWPWLVQIGYGRGGWYSYDWIDNDGKPSADRIVPELQDLRVGQRIEMVPGMGPELRAAKPPEWLVAGDEEGVRWCLGLYPDGDGGTRLVSRWRQKWTMTPANAIWLLIAAPGAFIMERRMLKGIKVRVERAAAAAGTPSPALGGER